VQDRLQVDGPSVVIVAEKRVKGLLSNDGGREWRPSPETRIYKRAQCYHLIRSSKGRRRMATNTYPQIVRWGVIHSVFRCRLNARQKIQTFEAINNIRLAGRASSTPAAQSPPDLASFSPRFELVLEQRTSGEKGRPLEQNTSTSTSLSHRHFRH
jgi:hypothetical protein